jgi:carbamoyl-phosphate synthase large subunit
MTNLTELTTRQADEWLRAIEQCAPYDFYHLPQYHGLAEKEGEGSARLLVYREGNHVIALPLLLRNLDEVAVSTVIGTGWMDATSVYGYPGPIASAAVMPAAVIANFQAALRERLRTWRVVTVFSRLNSFLPQRPLLTGLGDFQVSQTVSIDLTLPISVQRSKYRRTLNKAIARLRQRGLTVVRDPEGSHFDAFVRIYHETMHRVEAEGRYFFPASYFAALRESLGSRLELFMCLDREKPVCGGLFGACHGILQGHLGGTLDEALHMAPMKLLYDEVRLWGSAQGFRVLHLGGGRTTDLDDPLLYFKRGFSDRFDEFAVWRWVVAPEQDALLCDANARRLASQGLRPALANYFPAYRCPCVPCDPVAPPSVEGNTRRAPGRLLSGANMNVLLTCAGRRNYLVQYFKRALGGRGQVVACDSSASAPALAEADQPFIVPPIGQDDYFDVLLSICRAQRVRLILSVNDLELGGLAYRAAQFRAAGIFPVIASPQVIATCMDKWATFRFLQDADIATPRTYLSLADARQAVARGVIRFPLLIKPRWGSGSIGVELVENDRELELAHEWGQIRIRRTILAQLSRVDPENCLVIQELLTGQEYGLDVVNDLQGRYVATLARRKLVMRAGETDRAVTVVEPKVERLGRALGQRLAHVGSLDCDVLATEKGCFVLDLNPRFGGGYPFAHLAGADVPAALIAWANNEEPDPAWLRVRPGVLSSKYYGVVVMDEAVQSETPRHLNGKKKTAGIETQGALHG